MSIARPLHDGINAGTARVVLQDGRFFIEVSNPNELTQVIGWFKFRSAGGTVLYRGQTRVYDDMMPTGIRKKALRGKEKFDSQMKQYIDDLVGPCSCAGGSFKSSQSHSCSETVSYDKDDKKSIFRGTYRAVLEPLLQHYGVDSRWLDVVDNVWVALWFACHRQITKKDYAFHARRSPAQEPDSYAYIAVFDTGVLEDTLIPGYKRNSKFKVVDLRYSVPSVYLRPHAQHGLLVSADKWIPANSGSLEHAVEIYVKIKLSDALNWLGEGGMTTPHVLMPPAALDEGYRRLLKFAPPPPASLGYFINYGPGY